MLRSVILRNFLKLQPVRLLSLSARCSNKAEESENLTHFGFETVKSSEKAEKGEILQILNLEFIPIETNYSSQSV